MSRAFIFLMLRDGRLRSFKLGKSRRISVAELDRVIAAAQATADELAAQIGAS